ncbi:DUF1707 SHOCT-like domain-containing protein [Phytohabitans rumicis]|uniref:DUF1707 domain-containing protein n=1 Tax=Phytohabitans rumicis TaxID=1076125 RepID=A0A6V8KZD8_9ACTN|nr:DUF1707 domain-containing protein [Phytohabitans rumicis]GFJ90453.1 hypothetical protein Prum_040950 [Phytohabitans rumicis]
MSNADRERIVQRLNDAASEGRITLAEFEERVAGVWAAATYGEVEPYVADLPVAPGLAPPREVAELRSIASELKRKGVWAVPRRIVASNKAGSVKLDFTDAVISHPVVEISLDVVAGSTVLVMPPGASVDATDVQTVAGSVKHRGVPEAGGSPHFVVTGRQSMGSLVVRHQYRFWRWRW